MLPDIKRSELSEKRNIPLNEVMNMQRGGMSPQQIATSLEQRRFNQDQISEALSQATIKNEVGRAETPIWSQNQRNNVVPPGTFLEQPSLPLELLNAPSPSYIPEEQVGAPKTVSISSMKPQIQEQPLTTFSSEAPARASYEMVEEIVESVVKEKWDDMIKNVGDIKLWKERMQVDTNAIKQEILRMQDRMDSLQKSLIGKLTDYDQGVKEIGTEIKALEQVLQKIIGPLTKNIKELEKVTEEIKKRR